MSTPSIGDRTSAIRIMVAVELPLIRAGVKSLIDLQDDLEVVATIERLEDVLPECERLEPDLVILDTNFHRRKLTLIDEIHATVKDTGVLVLVNHSDEECVIRSMLANPESVKLSSAALDQLNECCLLALRSSARGCVPKTSGEDRLLSAIRTVASGEIAAGPWLDAIVQARASEAPSFSQDGPNRISARELEIITLVARGLENKEIGQHLGIREQTVKNHLGRIMRKVDVRNRQELALFAVKQHLVSGGTGIQ
ncbi:MAG: response regulator transcription factor [Gemmatimonadetes bacterium]|nr:response regulator transcription factor [Gemmatimonadota bacterium]